MYTTLFLIAAYTMPSVQPWQDAKDQVSKRYPQYKQQIAAMQRPTVAFRKGIFYDPSVAKNVYGSCVLGRTPEVMVGVVRDAAINRDTILHEYKHAITFRLPLSDASLAEATNWIDSEDIPKPSTKTIGGRAKPKRSK